MKEMRGASLVLTPKTAEEEAAEEAAAALVVRRRCRDADLILDVLGLDGAS